MGSNQSQNGYCVRNQCVAFRYLRVYQRGASHKPTHILHVCIMEIEIPVSISNQSHVLPLHLRLPWGAFTPKNNVHSAQNRPRESYAHLQLL